MSFLENCRRLIGLESTPGHGNLAAAEFVGRLCEEAGLHVELERESVEGRDQCNVIARPSATWPKEEILFQTHLDTVEAGHFGQWTKTQANPFNASIYNDVIYGLGSADVKLDFLCKLEALSRFAGRPMKRPFVLVGTFGAQNGMTGAIKLVRRKKLNAKFAFIGEPTEMKPVVSGQGFAVVEISVPFSEEEIAFRRDHDLMESTSTQSRMFAGRAAHSSNPSLGENAIMKMLAYMAQLPDGIAVMDLDGGVNHNSVPAHAVLEIDTVAGFREPILPKISRIYASLLEMENELRSFHAEGFDPPYPTMNLGMIRTFQEEVRITGSCRLPPNVTDADYDRWMRLFGQQVREAGATFRVKEYRKGFSTAVDTSFLKEVRTVLQKMDLPTQPERINVTTEASVFHRMGVECLVWGPGQGVGNSHAPNECIKISDLRMAVEFYAHLAERFCL